ncbi:MAG: hypothetical protein IPH08_04440 [Rhodocyclaceae bacterium]|nr:hypothetical protein [Rhodocyclaceae bacterium]
MATYERIDYGSADGSQMGGSASDKLGFYGKVPVVQRPYSSALHATSGYRPRRTSALPSLLGRTKFKHPDRSGCLGDGV